MTLGLAAPAAADTPERHSPFTPRQAPSEQYTSPPPPASGGADSGGAPGQAGPGQGTTGRGDSGGAGGAGGGDRRGGGGGGDGAGPGAGLSRPVAVTPPPRSEPQGIADAGKGLPYTGGALAAVVGMALLLLATGAALRAAARGPLRRRST